jgi:peptide deformylase
MKIILWPDPILKKVSQEVEVPQSINAFFLQEMYQTMRQANGVGLSAIQVGHPIRVVVSDIRGVMETFINPRLFVHHDSKIVQMIEGCLSTPGIFEPVWRPERVIVEYFKPSNGEKVLEEADGLKARMLQHECEHLDGKVYVDHLKAADRSRVRGLMLKMKRNGKR